MKRLAGVAGVLAAVVSLGCGSDGGEQSQLLPHDVGQNLAGRSEKVRAALEHGQGCLAQRHADQLVVAVNRSIDQNRVPPELRAELQRRATRLADSIVCVPAPAPPPLPAEEDEDEEGDGKKDKKDKHGEEDD